MGRDLASGLGLLAAPLTELPDLRLDQGQALGDVDRQGTGGLRPTVQLSPPHLGLLALHRMAGEPLVYLGNSAGERLPPLDQAGGLHIQTIALAAHRSGPFLKTRPGLRHGPALLGQLRFFCLQRRQASF